MKTLPLATLAALLLLGTAATAAPAPTLDQAVQGAADDFHSRVAQAADELNRTRAQIAAEKAPLLEKMRAAQDRVLAAEGELRRLDTRHEDANETRRKLLLELEAIRKSTSYFDTLSRDALKAAASGLSPGEDQFLGEPLRALQEQFDRPGNQHCAPALATARFLLGRTETGLGGYRAPGRALLSDSNEVLAGTFAFVGPEAFFLPEKGDRPGVLRPREGSRLPVSHPLVQWPAPEARRFFAGETGALVADASGGKALRLQETTGTLWDHIRKGGLVAFGIVGVGLLALLMILQKTRELLRMGVDRPAVVEAFLELVAQGDIDEATQALPKLSNSTRELFLAGLRNVGQPTSLLEEKLQAVLLSQRLHYERRLPLLAVIATAAPLMGLLGTVVGMVKTFALITVFGTGNAAKLSSGISEVLVATELGLTVAIPTLVAHGFLAHRLQRNLSQLERQALQFVTAVGNSRLAPTAAAVAPARETGTE